MYSRDLVFGDGMTEITAPPTLEVFEVPRRKKRVITTKEIVILVSVFAPWVFGMTFAALMVRYTAFYILYWLATYAYSGFVLYANTKARRSRRSHRAKEINHMIRIPQRGGSRND